MSSFSSFFYSKSATCSFFGFVLTLGLEFHSIFSIIYPLLHESLTTFTNLSSTVWCMCWFHSFLRCKIHVLMLSTVYVHLMISFLLMSSNIFPKIWRSILISVVSKRCFIFNVSGFVSDVYVIVGLIVILYINLFVSYLKYCFPRLHNEDISLLHLF